MMNSKILPLRGLNLKSKPLNQRAIAWSCDAELAIAADDSIYICLPQFPILDPSPEDSEVNENDTDIKSDPEDDDSDSEMGFLSSRLPKQYGDSDDEYDDELEEDSEDDDIELVATSQSAANGHQNGDDNHAAAVRANVDPVNTSDPRQQFFDGMRHMPISYPPLSPELNAHVWAAAGKEMPLVHTNVRGTRDRDVTPKDGDGDGTEDKDEDDEAGSREAGGGSHDVNYHPGAGAGVIGSAGTSLNHVVAIEWSPSGLGKNWRPVLGVLTGCGSLAVYGEGCASPFGSTARPFRSVSTNRKGAVRNLASWVVLWAVGENFVVPGQEEFGYGEFVKAFAWSQGAGGGKAFLGYMNDQREIVILCVGTEYRKSKEDGLDVAVWNVQEMCRFEAEGPHTEQGLMDPDFVPGGSSFCLRWGPWIKGEDTWTCVLSYMDKNYIGFRRITVNAPTWKPAEAPIVTYDSQDWDGRCIHLGADAFLEFENTVWTVGDRKICRGYIATPLVAEPFEVDLAESNPHRPRLGHATDQCNTTYDNNDCITNPITGLIVHPVSLETVSPSLVPFYTAVRLAATATNHGWWESNLVKSDNDGEEPKWVTEIKDKITTATPLGLAGLAGSDDEDGDSEDEEAQDKDEDWDSEDECSSSSSSDSEADAIPAASDGPYVHPLRVRIWGLAASPGGGSTAVLATQQLTQKPERGGWYNHRSRVMFDHRLPRPPQDHGGGAGAGTSNNDHHHHQPMDLDFDGDEDGEDGGGCTVKVDDLSTEARLWEYMYGGGPGVPGITHYPEPVSDGGDRDDDGNINTNGTHKHDNNPGKAQKAIDALAQARRDKIRQMFEPFVREQTCSICADGASRFLLPSPPGEAGTREGRTRTRTRLDCVCEHGHRVALCGASGLAILEPGISRCCGVCQWRCLDVDVLLERVLVPAGRVEEAEMVGMDVRGDVCVRCGGKYLD